MGELPESVVEAAVRLTRLARQAVDRAEAAAYRDERDTMLADHGYVARVRADDGDPVLVCHPDEWVEDGVVQPDRIDDLGRAVERPLDGGGSEEDWATVDAHNRELVGAVEAAHGAVHARTVGAFADFMGNHYARRIETAGDRECREFLEEYLPRNAWPTDEQVALAETSLALAFDAADARPPGWIAPAGTAADGDSGETDR